MFVIKIIKMIIILENDTISSSSTFVKTSFNVMSR